MVKTMKEKQQAKKKKKRFQISPERKKQMLAYFLVFLMIGSALVLMVSY